LCIWQYLWFKLGKIKKSQRALNFHVPRPPTGGKFAVAGLKIAGASENFVLNY
jgi:hypothetical protein